MIEAIRNLIPWRWRRLIEVSFGWGLALELCHFEEHWSLHLHLLYVNIFLRVCPSRTEPRDILDKWGFSVHAGTDWGAWTEWHLTWGGRGKIVYMPWAWEHVRTSVLGADGRRWFHELSGEHWRRELPGVDQRGYTLPRDLPRWTLTLPYRYMLHSGEQQNVNATISVEEREWRWRWFKWLASPRMIHRTIHVEFDGEVGERAGSWKGGTVGCSYELRDGEAPADCLRRMEQEREFR